MARTQAADYDKRRQGIVAAAAGLFAQRGFSGVSVAEIATRCKTSKALIYHYYQAKEDILFDVMISHIRDLDTAARDIIASNDSAEAKLRHLARAFMRLYVDAADQHKVLLNDLHNLPKPRRAEIVVLQRDLIAIVRDMLCAIEPRLKRGGKSHAMAMLFFGMINWTHTWYSPKGAVKPDALADMAVNLTLGGLARALEP